MRVKRSFNDKRDAKGRRGWREKITIISVICRKKLFPFSRLVGEIIV